MSIRAVLAAPQTKSDEKVRTNATAERTPDLVNKPARVGAKRSEEY